MQTLSVVRHGSRSEIMSLIAKCSEHWNSVHKFGLLKNICVRDCDSNFAEWILKIRKGTLSTEQNLNDKWNNLPLECIVLENELVRSIFDKLFHNEFSSFKDR